MAEQIEQHDMQRLILEGYQRLPFARYALLTIKKEAAPQARAWLASALAADRIGTANERGRIVKYELGIAFTHAGLEAIGLRAKGFLAPFREGMITPARSADLGDTGLSAPAEWLWGNGIHVLLMLFSKSKEERDDDWNRIELGLDWASREGRSLLDGYIDPESKKEHFGFRDGISQPIIEGSETSRARRQQVSAFDSVKPGEFVLGYRNEANVFPTSPYIAVADYRVPEKPAEALRARITNPDRIDFGRNGTYLVLRQLRQEVEKFEKYVETQVRPTGEDPDAQRMWIKAKMVGRWPSGAPLVKAPSADRPELRNDNDFGFHESDRYGHACPVGSHIRRSNPRDSLVDEQRGIGPEEALRRSRRHRLIRRGRLYDATKAENPREAKAGKGVLFLCLNANIQDQFEFVQHRWVNAPDFGGLDGETDPLVGPRPDQSAMCPMTIPGANGTRRIHGLERFVEVLGGAYFFMPGIKALKCLANLGGPSQTAGAPIRSSNPSISD